MVQVSTEHTITLHRQSNIGLGSLTKQPFLYSPTVLAATNFMEAGSLTSSDSSGGLANSGLVGWLWSKV